MHLKKQNKKKTPHPHARMLGDHRPTLLHVNSAFTYAKLNLFEMNPSVFSFFVRIIRARKNTAVMHKYGPKCFWSCECLRFAQKWFNLAGKGGGGRKNIFFVHASCTKSSREMLDFRCKTFLSSLFITYKTHWLHLSWAPRIFCEDFPPVLGRGLFTFFHCRTPSFSWIQAR